MWTILSEDHSPQPSLIHVGMQPKGPCTTSWCQDLSQLTLRPHQVTFHGQLFVSFRAEIDRGLRLQ